MNFRKSINMRRSDKVINRGCLFLNRPLRHFKCPRAGTCAVGHRATNVPLGSFFLQCQSSVGLCASSHPDYEQPNV